MQAGCDDLAGRRRRESAEFRSPGARAAELEGAPCFGRAARL